MGRYSPSPRGNRATSSQWRNRNALVCKTSIEPGQHRPGCPIPLRLAAGLLILSQSTGVRIPEGDPVLTGIPFDRVDEFWPQIEPILLRAILRTDGRHSWLSVKNACRNQDWQLWAAFEDPTMAKCVAAMTTQLLTFPTGVTDCEITLAAGKVIPRALPMLEIVETWAKSLGCASLVLNGRPGWCRILNSTDTPFEESSRVLRRSLR